MENIKMLFDDAEVMVEDAKTDEEKKEDGEIEVSEGETSDAM